MKMTFFEFRDWFFSELRLMAAQDFAPGSFTLDRREGGLEYVVPRLPALGPLPWFLRRQAM